MDDGEREITDYILARSRLAGKEGDLDQLWKVVVAADKMQDRAERLLSFAQAIAERLARHPDRPRRDDPPIGRAHD